MRLHKNQILWSNSSSFWLLIAIGLILSFYWMFQQILMPFIVAIIIAYILQPIVEKLAQFNFSRAFSATLLVGGFLCFIISASLFAFPLVKDQLLSISHKLPTHLQLLEDTLVPYFSKAVGYLDESSISKIKTTLSNYFGDMLSWLLRLVAGLFASSLAIANLISLIILTPLITFYILRDWPKIEKFFKELVPLKSRQSYHSLISEIQQTLSAYFRGQASVCVILSLYYIAGLAIIGFDFAFIIGFISGILAFIPYVGFIISFVAALGISIAQFASLKGGLMIAAVYGSGHLIEAYYLTPKLVGDRIGLHPVWVIFSLLAGGVIAGFSGILIALPVAAIINILLRFLFNSYWQSPAFLGRPLRTTSVESKENIKISQE